VVHPQGPTLRELARQGLSSTRQGYDLLAPKFDYTPFRTPDEVLDAVRERLRPQAPFDSVLDLCCGTGAAIKALRPLCSRRLVGVDFSSGMLEEARRRLGLADHVGSPEVALVSADVLELPYAEEFDLVTCFGAFGHIPRTEERRFVRNIHRALRPGGRFAFVTHRMPPPLSPMWLFGRGYNAVTHLRNLLVRPAFVMFYLTFTLEDAKPLLESEAFRVEVLEDVFPKPFHRNLMVVATRS